LQCMPRRMGRGMSGNLNRSKSAMKPYGNVILMTAICIAIFTLFMAPRPAHAQRCPAGQDAFLNCLPLNHQGYRATNEISIRQQEYARSHSGRTGVSSAPSECARRYINKLAKRRDPRVLRASAGTYRRGDTREAAETLRYTPDFQSVHREAFRACGLKP
jgi:hypothetical protein